MRIKKKLLSEKALYFAQAKMPKGFEINRPSIVSDIFLSNFYEDYKPPFNKALHSLIIYVSDFMRLENKLDLIPHNKKGMFFEKNENSNLMLEIDPTDLKNSPDFVMLYAAEVEDKTCEVVIEYDDNRRAGKDWTILMENNRFIIFPSTQKFYIKNKNNSHLNFIQLVNFEYIG
jgi:hypothetical protein|tara:strand:- start:1507 stop:2028 length:522 start_codon:yes stop_codon:yes gene_type:complete